MKIEMATSVARHRKSSIAPPPVGGAGGISRGGKSPAGRQRAMSASANGGVIAQGQRRPSSGNANDRSISEGKKRKFVLSIHPI